jgi:glycogen debranching enzyme
VTPRVLVAGATCLLTTGSGDVASGSDGLFVDDTRHLSRWELTVHGRALRVLRSSPTVVLAPETTRGENPPFVVHRTQTPSAAGLAETLRVDSFADEPQTVRVSVAAGADFADQFELRTDRVFDKPDAVRASTVDDGSLEFTYARQGFARRTVVTVSSPGRLSADGAQWTITLPPRGSATLRLTVSTGAAPAKPRHAAPADMPTVAQEPLARAVRRGLADLDALLIPSLGVPAAGAPWFLTLFGRDSLLTSLFALPYRPELAEGTLRALAALQGSSFDASRVEEPGKIPHETRRGELATLGLVPYGRYYGSVDATPLFLAVLAAHHELTGDGTLAKELEGAARAAVSWMRGPGGLDATGWLRYPTDAPGLVHHCWKDSADSIVSRSGSVASGPVAVCEAQAYAYRALVGAARLATYVWGDPTWAAALCGLADGLRSRFATAFRLDDDFVALALDGADRPVDALASNAGHVLWSGIMDEEWASTVGSRLAADDFFSGWGIRTLAAGQTPYHPLSYHRGGVWPHDTAIAVAGLAAAGLHSAAGRVADGLLAAASYTDDRLPEVMTGLAREPGAAPVPYPHSCSPQAWAAAAPLLLLTTLR